MSEYELLQDFNQKRSEEAFAELVRRYAGLVYSVAKRRLANASLAQDITQIVFIRFAKTPPKVKNHAELAAWLHRTTLNVTIDTWRSETRRRNREQQAIVMEPATTDNSIWEDIAPNLDEALNQLNEDDRQALLLRFFGRKTMREVGAVLGVSEDAAKMRVSRALDRLRTQMGAASTVCTTVVLGTLLTERSVEAVPTPLLSRLAALRLPAAATVVGTGGLLTALLRISKFNLAIGSVVLAVIGVSTMHLVWSMVAPFPGVLKADSKINLTSNDTNKTNRITDRGRFDSSGFNKPLPPPAAPVKTWFHVMDAETGNGLANTKIHVAYFGAGGIGESHDVLTDNSGVAAIPEPDDATKNHGPNVFVTAEGHVPKVVGFQDVMPDDYVMKLDPAMMAGGLVVDEQGMPVAGVKIMIQGPGNKLGQSENIDFQTCPVTNQDDGSWSCSYIPKDFTNEIRFILKKPGYAVTTSAVPVPRVDLTNLVLVIDRGFTVVGQVMDPQNQPVADASVKTLGSDSNKQQSAKTDETGGFTLTGIPLDNYMGPKWTIELPEIETNNNGGAIVNGGYAFYGFEQYARETNDGVVVLVRHLVSWPGETNHPQMSLVVQAKGFASREVTVELIEATNVTNLTLSPGNIFRGRVVDEAGKPIPNTVIRTDYDFKNQIPPRFEWSTHTDGNGQFEWDSAPAEEVCYWFEANGYNVIRGTPFLADNSDHEITLKSKVAK
jgi:RNA polymerase sigma factor (sigma-70 family)